MKTFFLLIFLVPYMYGYAIKVKDLSNERGSDTTIIESDTGSQNYTKNKDNKEDIYNFKKRKRLIVPPVSSTQYKDPRLSCLLSTILPGGGHIYLRKDLKGTMFCISTASAYAIGGYYLYQGYSPSASETTQKNGLVYGAIATIIGAILHAVGIVEAYNDAIEINESYYLKKAYNKPTMPSIKVAKK